MWQLLDNILGALGRSTLFLGQVTAGLPSLIPRPRLVLAQIYAVGVLSLVIIAVAGLFVGMVLGLQGYYMLSRFGAEDSLGVMVALSLIRELGPVLTALLFAGRAGSSVAAEIGLMRATEQLSAMEMMAVDPVKRVVAPRLLAAAIAVPLLAFIFTAVGIMGGYFMGVDLLGVDAGAYWSQIQNSTDFRTDIFQGLIVKSTVFGITVGWIAVYLGYTATPTSEGVSRATTLTVVISSLAVLGLDFILTGLLFSGV